MTGSLPGADFFRVDPAKATTPPIVPTQFPAITPVEPAASLAPEPIQQNMQPIAAPPVRYVAASVGVPGCDASRRRHRLSAAGGASGASA